MLVTIDTSDARPVFRQIVDEVQRCVAIGLLKPSDPLPAVRTLAGQLKINANTVQHAYRTLEQEGTVTVRRGLGTFVTAAPKTRDSHIRQQTIARQIAEKMLREAYRQGLLASDLMKALQEIAPRRDGGASGSRGQEKV